ncbi:Aspartyl protease family protein [Thalictrum thalictroides]|uniref:Aspartyl protease family protein n=1 Tax=Thalictrum thalictroides TaxID=46969 RepID=A0A7J6V3D9_THATH|nr:Aspartyl protease family protein [Thalictrum thalictroides]
MDTGSDLVWFPCTQRYLCKNCTFSNPNTKLPTFLPKNSTSSKLIGCKNPKCSWIHNTDVNTRCKDCKPNSKICSQICPPYIVIYGSASTGGILLSETLDLPEKKIPNFAVGCSLFASRSPAGIAGFGRGSASLPSQLGLNKFSYCLVSHRFDDSTQSSSLVLDGGDDSGDTKTTGVSYTPFIKNPVTGRAAFSVYYYVGLKKITVGKKTVKIPNSYLFQRPDGNGGTIVDSGSTFTFMEGRVFKIFASEVESQMTHFKKATDIEAITGLRPCYDISGEKSVTFPKLVLHFKGGADMEIPLSNYFSFIGGNGVVCMTIISDGVVGDDNNMFGGPAVILGNYQFQNYYVEYDLENQRFGFRQKTCK